MKVKTNRIYNIDYREGIKSIDNNSIGLLLTDPPYNVTNKDTAKLLKKLGKNYYDEMMKFDHGFDFFEYMKIILEEFNRIGKDGAYIVYFWLDIVTNAKVIEYAESIGYKRKINQFTWIKRNQMPNFMKVNFRSSAEYATILQKKRSKKHKLKDNFNYLDHDRMRNYYESNVLNDKQKLKHPNGKPIALLQTLISILSNENDIVLDCFSGGGSTAIASIRENRRFIGFEINKKYYENSIYYINEEIKQTDFLRSVQYNLI